MTKKVIKKEKENKIVSDIILQSCVQALVISIILLLLFCKCNATMF
jgi:hypothetical protein